MLQISDADLKDLGSAYIPEGYDADLYRIRHSAAHILAWAVREHFKSNGQVLFGIGPPVKDGFYYDFGLPRPINEHDLPAIEKRMRRLIERGDPFVPAVVSETEARSLFADQPLKMELIDGLSSHEFDEDGQPVDEPDDVVLTTFTVGDFVDLCRGPHVPSAKAVSSSGLKLLNTSSAYWRGDPAKRPLIRIYGTAWRNKEELDLFLWRRAEAEKRDHRKLGKQLELFHFDETAPGMPYWLPNGLIVLNSLIDFWRREHTRRGYKEIATPLINKKGLWVCSGHWEHYRADMFMVQGEEADGEDTEYAIKPMNCPNAMIVFNLKVRSYRELPLRFSDCDPLHRFEASGALHGLLRVRKFQQDDAHIFVQESQIEGEYERIIEICNRFYSIFGMKYKFRIGTRPASFMGDPETWDKAESALRRILDKHAGPGEYLIAEGDGAFYGPKIDILMEDCIGRTWQMGTIQLDFQLPRRFDCKFVDEKGTLQTPVVIHRVIYGSLERFIGILIEHTAGAFPFWLAPVQSILVPIADRHVPYCEQIAERMREHDFRVSVDARSERMNAKVRDAQLQKIPYICVVGDKEAGSDSVSLRLRTGKDAGPVSVDELISRMEGVRQAMVDL